MGAMLDPIADKALVLVTCLSLARYSTIAPIFLLSPMIFIVFREVFVAGIREFLGQASAGLQVTRIAKYKTAFQLLSLGLLLGYGVAEHYFVERVHGMSEEIVMQLLAENDKEAFGVRFWFWLMQGAAWSGLITLWAAAVLTVVSGIDYFRKAVPQLKEMP